jgi:hypothetical protein
MMPAQASGEACPFAIKFNRSTPLNDDDFTALAWLSARTSITCSPN